VRFQRLGLLFGQPAQKQPLQEQHVGTTSWIHVASTSCIFPLSPVEEVSSGQPSQSSTPSSSARIGLASQRAGAWAERVDNWTTCCQTCCSRSLAVEGRVGSVVEVIIDYPMAPVNKLHEAPGRDEAEDRNLRWR
jgi:hypothetical protein